MEAIIKFVNVNRLQENEVAVFSTHNNKHRLFYDRSRLPVPNRDEYYAAGGHVSVFPIGLSRKDFSILQEEFLNEPN